MKESLGRMSLIFPTFPSIFRSYYLVLRGHTASLRGLLSPLIPLILCLHPLVYYSHTLIEFPWERIGVVYKLALSQELLNLSAQPTYDCLKFCLFCLTTIYDRFLLLWRGKRSWKEISFHLGRFYYFSGI